MSPDHDAPEAILDAARALLGQPRAKLEGAWPRAVAVLTRQALETAVARCLQAELGPMGRPTFTAQLTLLRQVHPDPALAARVAYTWEALSAATHHQGYELNPTAVMLRGWQETVGELVETGAA